MGDLQEIPLPSGGGESGPGNSCPRMVAELIVLPAESQRDPETRLG